MLPYIKKKKDSVLHRKRKIGLAVAAVGGGGGGGDPFGFPTLVNALIVDNIIPYNGLPLLPQTQWFDSKSVASFDRAVGGAPPYLNTTNVGGKDYAIISAPNGVHGIFNPNYASRMLVGCSSLTWIMYLKDAGAINPVNRYICYSSASFYPTAPFFRFLIAGGVRTLHVSCRCPGPITLTTQSVNDYSITGSLVVVTFDSTTGTLNLYTKFGTVTSINAGWINGTLFYGGGSAQSEIMSFWDPAATQFIGNLGDIYTFSSVLSNIDINKIANWYINKFALIAADVWTPI